MVTSSRALSFALALPIASLGIARAQSETFDAGWTVTVEGQSLQAEPDGTFRILNVAAPDLFGAQGPGTAPDQISDEFVRVTAFRSDASGTRYALSEPFRMEQGQTYVFTASDFVFTDLPPPLPVALTLELDQTLLTSIGQVAQATTTAELPDGSLLDVSSAEAWTTYTSSNPAVLTVAPDGRITATGAGTAFVAATNDGATAIAVLSVSPGDPETTVEGFVFDALEQPIAGAMVEVEGQGLVATTGADGKFSIPGVLTGLGALTLSVEGNAGGSPLLEVVTGIVPLPGAVTDVGVVFLVPPDGSRYLYVNNGIHPLNGSNSISAFRVLAGGALEALEGSPFSTGQSGPFGGGGFGCSIAIAGGGSWLLALNAASETVSAFDVGPDGSLSELPASPVGSDLREPIAASAAGFLYAQRLGSGQELVTFSVAADGIEEVGSLALPGPAGPTMFALDPSGSRLFALFRSGTGLDSVRSYAIDGTGQPVEVSESFVAGDLTAIGATLDGSKLYGGEQSPNFVTSGAVRAFDVLLSGELFPIGASSYGVGAFQPKAPTGFAMSIDGGLAYMTVGSNSSNGPGTVTLFEIGADGLLTERADSPVPTANYRSICPVITADGASLFVLNTDAALAGRGIVRFGIEPDGGLDAAGPTVTLGTGANDVPTGMVLVD